MKLIITLFILLFILPATAQNNVFARADNSTPHIVIEGDVWLYSDKGEKIFILPTSYYARINNLDDTYYYVTFNGVAGRVKKSEVRAVGYEFQATGTTADLNISSEYADFYGISLKKHPDSQADNLLTIPSGNSFTYIGTYPTDSGEKWYYVKYENVLGYLKASRTTAPDMEIPLFTPEVSTTPESEEEDMKEVNNTIKGVDSKELKIIIIVGLALPAIGIVILIFKRKKGA